MKRKTVLIVTASVLSAAMLNALITGDFRAITPLMILALAVSSWAAQSA